MLSDDTIQRIEQSLANTKARILIISNQDGDFIVKRQRPKRKDHILIALRKLVASVLRIPAFVPAKDLGGRAAQENELAKLRELRTLGIDVPKVELIRSDYFVMRKVGSQNLAETIEKSSKEDAVRLWKAGLETLLKISQQNTNLSQAHARNFVIGEDEKLYAIDFEDNPKACLGPLQAQTRDWLFYLSSTLWMLPMQNTEKAAVVRGFFAKLPKELAQAIEQASRLGTVLRFLPSNRKWVGRDIMTIQTTAQVLHLVFEKH